MGRVRRAGAPESEGQPAAHQDPARARGRRHRPGALGRPRPLHGAGRRARRRKPGKRERVLTSTRARELRDQAIVTGDRVDVVGDTSGAEGSLSRIVRIQPRTTLLRRSADDTDEVERIIVANADQLMIVVAAADPEPRPRLVDRYLVAAYDAGIAPLIVITKTDLADPEPFLANFAGLDIPVFRSKQDTKGVTVAPIDELAPALAGTPPSPSGTPASASRPSSTPSCPAPIARSASSTPSPGAAGTPRRRRCRCGCRPAAGSSTPPASARSASGTSTPTTSCGRSPTSPRSSADCPRGCTHLPDAPDCALNEAVADGRLPAAARRLAPAPAGYARRP